MPYAIELKALVPSQLAKAERENRPVAVAVRVLGQIRIFGDRLFDRLQVLRAGLLDLQTMVRQGHCALTLDAVKVLLRTSAELMEHDADRAPRDEGWTASTPEEVRKLFARL